MIAQKCSDMEHSCKGLRYHDDDDDDDDIDDDDNDDGNDDDGCDDDDDDNCDGCDDVHTIACPYYPSLSLFADNSSTFLVLRGNIKV